MENIELFKIVIHKGKITSSTYDNYLILMRYFKLYNVNIPTIKRRIKNFENYRMDIYKFFDNILGWNGTREGFMYWYFHQLNLTKLFAIKTNFQNKNIIQYYNSLLKGYNHYDYDHIQEWINHKNFFETTLKKYLL